jgi:hypothetical protein
MLEWTAEEAGGENFEIKNYEKRRKGRIELKRKEKLFWAWIGTWFISKCQLSIGRTSQMDFGMSRGKISFVGGFKNYVCLTNHKRDEGTCG